jgi:3-isopropylmalate/(R)-2-methylmalate dehydratase small subunit
MRPAFPDKTMQAFTTLTSQVIPLPYSDIDTDQIIPARFLKVTDKGGLAEGLFSGWRYRADSSPEPDFPLNRPEHQGSQILLVGDNFGCGSSREHAPWALAGWGLRAIISTSFADIFRSNALKNGLLPVAVEAAVHERLFKLSAAGPLEVTIDLAKQAVILPDGGRAGFPIDPFSKLCLLEGVDSLGYLLKHKAEIRTFEQRMQEI